MNKQHKRIFFKKYIPYRKKIFTRQEKKEFYTISKLVMRYQTTIICQGSITRLKQWMNKRHGVILTRRGTKCHLIFLLQCVTWEPKTCMNTFLYVSLHFDKKIYYSRMNFKYRNPSCYRKSCLMQDFGFNFINKTASVELV